MENIVGFMFVYRIGGQNEELELKETASKHLLLIYRLAKVLGQNMADLPLLMS